MNTLENIVNMFPITNEEYEILDKKFGKLCHYAAWELKRKNAKNANINDPDDDVGDKALRTRNGRHEKISGKRKKACPQEPPDDVISEKFAVLHLANPRQNRSECPHGGNKACKDDTLWSMFFKKDPRIFKSLPGEPS